MRSDFQDKPRVFSVNGIDCKDFGKLHLDEDEMVSLLADNGKECDITAKDWGYYLGPSLNGRLRNQGYKTALVINEFNKLFVMVVDRDKIEAFKKYVKTNQDNRIVCWLDEWLGEED